MAVSEWQRPFIVTLVLILLVVLGMAALGMGPATMLIVAIGAFLGSARWCLQPLLERTAMPEVPPRAIAAPAPPGLDQRVRRLRSGIIFSNGADSFSEPLYRSLIELIDDQLISAHGIDRQHDPVSAERIVGPELHDFVQHRDAARLLTRTSDLDRIVTLIEQI